MVKRFVAEFPREQILCAGSKLAIPRHAEVFSWFARDRS